MPVTTAVAIFFLIWWVVLFAVLPWGVRSQQEAGGEVAPGTDPGAPVLPNLGKKLLWTTIVSIVIFAGCYVVYVDRLVTLEDLLAPFGLHMTSSQAPDPIICAPNQSLNARC
jgi:predicted secreted protein